MGLVSQSGARGLSASALTRGFRETNALVSIYGDEELAWFLQLLLDVHTACRAPEAVTDQRAAF